MGPSRPPLFSRGLEINTLAVVAITLWAAVAFTLVARVCAHRALKLGAPWYVGVPGTAALGNLAFHYAPPSIALALGLMFVGLGLAVWTDLRFGLIFDAISWPTLIVVAIAVAFQGDWLAAAAGAAILSGFFGLFHIISRGAFMGLGDVKIALSIGAAFGLAGTVNCLVAVAFVALIGGIVLLSLGRRGEIVFGPFIGAGAALSLFFGTSLSQLLLHVG